MRPEFQVLKDYAKRLFDDTNMDPQFLRKAGMQLHLCSQMTQQTDEEKNIVAKAGRWWDIRAQAMEALKRNNATTSSKATDKVKDAKKIKIKIDDRIYLKSIKIDPNSWEEEDKD